MENKKLDESLLRLKEGNLEGAIESASSVLPDPERNALILLQYQLNSTSKDWRLGLVDKQGLDIVHNRIAFELINVISENKKKSAAYFLEQLEIEDFAKDPNFADAFSQTFGKVLETRKQEKIGYFAKLLTNTFSGEHPVDMDEFEFDLKALDILNFTEIRLISLLFEFEMKYSDEKTQDVNRLKNNADHWQEFLEMVESQINLSREHCEAQLMSIQKTGLLTFPRPSANDFRKYAAFTTVLFWRLRRKIALEML